MVTRLNLLKEFYQGLPKDRVKLETYERGFDYLDALLGQGATLEYGEMALKGGLHKYKLSGVPPEQLDKFLADHIAKTANVCLYFGGEENSLFCINLDNNHKTDNMVLIPEMEIAVRELVNVLSQWGCEPLVINSGRGFHAWCRVEEAVPNGKLYEIMLRAMARAFLAVHKQGFDHQQVKANFYPDPRSKDVVSLRVFGSDHARSRLFSRVLTSAGLLDEEESWRAFEEHLRGKTIAKETLEQAWRTANGGACA
jgi:hypothetical protein